MRKCTKCGEEKPTSDYYKASGKEDGFRRSCKQCDRAGQKLTAHVARDRNLRGRYGITLDDYNKMHNEQGGTCAICGLAERVSNRSLAVDHCHATGKVRGLLCSACNIALGKFQDDKERLLKAISYLGG